MIDFSALCIPEDVGRAFFVLAVILAVVAIAEGSVAAWWFLRGWDKAREQEFDEDDRTVLRLLFRRALNASGIDARAGEPDYVLADRMLDTPAAREWLAHMPLSDRAEPITVISLTGSTWTRDSGRFDGRLEVRLEGLVEPDEQVPMPFDRVALYRVSTEDDRG